MEPICIGFPWGDSMQRKRVRIWDLSNPSQGIFLLVAIFAFICGLFAGYVLAGGIKLPFCVSFRMQSDAPVTLMRFWGLLWSHFRWLLFAAVLSMTALGLFFLYPLVFVRGIFIGFSFSSLFTSGAYRYVLLHFLCTAALTVAPLLVCAACGVKRTFRELRHGGEDSLLDRPWFPLLMLLISLVLSILCSCAELWLLPGFVSYIQPVT